MKFSSNVISLVLFYVVIATGLWGFGAYSYRNQVFPVPLAIKIGKEAKTALYEIFYELDLAVSPGNKKRPNAIDGITVSKTDEMMPGLTLVSQKAEESSDVHIIDALGKVVHSWKIEWQKLWPNVDHLDSSIKPKSQRGTFIHGIELMPDGGLVFNYEPMGMIRVDACGSVKWRLNYQTHHSVHIGTNGNIYASGKEFHNKKLDRLADHKPSFFELTLVEISPEGKIIEKISFQELLENNGLGGLRQLGITTSAWNLGSGDTLHLNDVEPFPLDMEPGYFAPGDLLVSFRNINGIIVFNQKTRKVKYINIGQVIQQHDPDFVDGNSFTVFDNNNRIYWKRKSQSRIVKINALKGTIETVLQGTEKIPFFTDVMGMHQMLKNGNILVVETRNGRVFEVGKSGELVWNYNNVVKEGVVGNIYNAKRLSTQYNSKFFEDATKRCSENST